ncbi:MAG TPA: DUF1294 domain-containing protein [Firmicutes bacterium]|jgi:uncharacterized membrane protein YsdA (DUF1294 family)|nr:DUF1294 domain-containing protein [Bacillota bacterium]
MPDYLLFFGLCYFLAVSLWAIGLVLYDKRASRRGAWRIKEKTLLLVALLGGSIAMLTTMRLIHHKTRHAKFMFGIPAIIVLQLAGIGWFLWRRAGT